MKNQPMLLAAAVLAAAAGLGSCASIEGAVREGEMEKAAGMIKEGMDPDQVVEKVEFYGYGEEESVPLLMVFIAENDTASVRRLLDLGADPQKRFDPSRSYKKDFTPLYQAVVREENGEIAQLLLDAGADISEGWGDIPLICSAAMDCEDPELIRWLVEAGADVNALYPDTYLERDILDNGRIEKAAPLTLALLENPDVVEVLYELGGENPAVYRGKPFSSTAIAYMRFDRLPSYARLMLPVMRYEPEALGAYAEGTILSDLLRYGREEVARYILKTAPGIIDIDNRTYPRGKDNTSSALFWAVRDKDAETVQLLLGQGARAAGVLPFAKREGLTEMVSLLETAVE